MKRKLQKLRRTSLGELRVRGAQALAKFAERHSLSSKARLGSDSEFAKLFETSLSSTQLRDHFQTRQAPAFFAALGDRQTTVAQFRRHWPDAEQRIIGEAERILNGRFDLLGFRDLFFGNPIDWHFEPVANKRTPLLHWSRLNYLDAQIAGDKKIIWELNRHQYFARLGQAYWMSGDERYAQTFAAHLDSWMDQNPPKLGINWASSLEVAFRSISWLWAFYFFRDSPSFSSRTFMRALQYLYLHGRHLETYLSTYFSPNTHLTGEALGLYYLGLLLPEFTDAERWRQTGRRILLEQLPIHVRPDGVYFEQSSYYHRYTADFYTHFLILAQANDDVTASAEVADNLKALLDHLMYITRPDGTTPLFGDDDGGRLVMLDRHPANDFRATLSTGAVLFERADYKFVAAGQAEETLWLLGAAGLEILDQVVASEPSKRSVAFDSGGYYVMRDDWTPNANYLLFDCGPHGQANCGHAHADALAFDLAANGRTLLVDPGTYTYTGAKDQRDWFRSTAAHNTLTVDGRSSSVSAGPFSWKSIAGSQCLAWISCDRFDYVDGTHDGYATPPPPATHDRSILFLKHDYWIIRDRLKSAGERSMDLWFHFDPTSDPLIEAANEQEAFIAENTGETGLDVHSFAQNSRWKREDGWVSHCYAKRDPARVYVLSALLGDDRSVVSLLLPRTDTARWQVKEIEAIGGRAFEVANEKWLDIVMIRERERVETARLASDFEWTWVRFSRENASIPKELVLIGGQSLQFQNHQVLQTDQLISYLAARRVDGQFQVDTDNAKSDCQLLIADFEAALRG